MYSLGRFRVATFLVWFGLICLIVPLAFASDLHESPHKSHIDQLLEREFIKHDSNYVVDKTTHAARLTRLTAQLVEIQKGGANLACSDQLLVEAKWLLEHTSDWPRLNRQLNKLAESFQTTDQAYALQQSQDNGAWGVCYSEWFMKLDATIDAINALADAGKAPQYPLTFMQRITDPERLVSYLNQLLVSDIANTGVDQRDELGAVTGALSQLLFKPRLRRYVREHVKGIEFNDRYIQHYQEFLESSQDPSSGYWGAWYRINQRLLKTNDLSLTFHVISYSKGNVSKWPQIIDTTFSIKNQEYPYGWLHNGQYKHHNNYDVIKIFRYAWPHMSDQHRRLARTQLWAMIRWFVDMDMPMEGEPLFAIDLTFYSNRANYYYFGVSFLDEIGYWNKSKRFWTNQDFPGANALCHVIKDRLVKLNSNAPAVEATMEKLEANCPS